MILEDGERGGVTVKETAQIDYHLEFHTDDGLNACSSAL